MPHFKSLMLIACALPIMGATDTDPKLASPVVFDFSVLKKNFVPIAVCAGVTSCTFSGLAAVTRAVGKATHTNDELRGLFPALLLLSGYTGYRCATSLYEKSTTQPSKCTHCSRRRRGTHHSRSSSRSSSSSLGLPAPSAPAASTDTPPPGKGMIDSFQHVSDDAQQ